jgi:hypothetical protein
VEITIRAQATSELLRKAIVAVLVQVVVVLLLVAVVGLVLWEMLAQITLLAVLVGLE